MSLRVINKETSIRTTGQGLHSITDAVVKIVDSENLNNGVCNLFIQHTSASLIIQENADPSARRDLENWLNRLVPENDPLYTHTCEGPDDMPSHIKSILTQVSISIPIINGELALGTWQGIYIWEHRKHSHKRTVLISILGT